jgi:hypothetical protein
MDKWQIICPLTVETARATLVSSEGEKALRRTSLFAIQDLLYNMYNTAQPAVGSDSIVRCACVGETLFSIRANGVVDEIPVGDPRLVDFVKLVKAEHVTETRPVGVSNH